ncbi:hypothetical protein ACWDHW_19590 [Streptomyces melanosporofaciens]
MQSAVAPLLDPPVLLAEDPPDDKSSSALFVALGAGLGFGLASASR